MFIVFAFVNYPSHSQLGTPKNIYLIRGFSVQWRKYQVVYYGVSTLSLNLYLLFLS